LKAIVCSPFIFPPTQLTYAMANELEKLIRGFGWDVVRLQGPQNLRVIFGLTLQAHPDATLIAYLGHASSTALLGEELFGAGLLGVDNAGDAKERILVGLPACLSAQKLGPAAVQSGAKAFVGSKEEMMAQWNEVDHNYMADWFDYTLTFYRSLVASMSNNMTTKDALSKALNDYKERCSYYMDLYKNHLDTWPNADFYFVACRQNRDFVVGFIR